MIKTADVRKNRVKNKSLVKTQRDIMNAQTRRKSRITATSCNKTNYILPCTYVLTQIQKSDQKSNHG